METYGVFRPKKAFSEASTLAHSSSLAKGLAKLPQASSKHLKASSSWGRAEGKNPTHTKKKPYHPPSPRRPPPPPPPHPTHPHPHLLPTAGRPFAGSAAAASALQSGHARPSFSYRGALARQHPAPNSASEGHQVLGTFFIAKNALFPTETGLLDAFFGCLTGPGEHHRLYF